MRVNETDRVRDEEKEKRHTKRQEEERRERIKERKSATGIVLTHVELATSVFGYTVAYSMTSLQISSICQTIKPLANPPPLAPSPVPTPERETRTMFLVQQLYLLQHVLPHLREAGASLLATPQHQPVLVVTGADPVHGLSHGLGENSRHTQCNHGNGSKIPLTLSDRWEEEGV